MCQNKRFFITKKLDSKRILEEFLKILFPRKCGFCNQRIKEEYTCQNCKKNLEYICVKEIFKGENFEYGIFAYSYTGLVRKKILEFKFKNKKYLYKALTEKLVKNLELYQVEIDVVVSVPISWKRYLERGYNQSDLIANYISNKINKPKLKHVLIKNKNNLKQSTLKNQERIENVKDVYHVLRKEKLEGKTVLLVDDIVTTGATVEECSKVLKVNGARKVIVATIARAQMHKRD